MRLYHSSDGLNKHSGTISVSQEIFVFILSSRNELFDSLSFSLCLSQLLHWTASQRCAEVAILICLPLGTCLTVNVENINLMHIYEIHIWARTRTKTARLFLLSHVLIWSIYTEKREIYTVTPCVVQCCTVRRARSSLIIAEIHIKNIWSKMNQGPFKKS